MVVTTLTLDGLDNDGAGRMVPALDKVLNLVETSLFDLLVLLDVLLERVFKLGEGSLRPIKGRDVDLMNSLGSGCGKRSKETAVETSFEGEDRKVGATWRLVVHGTVELLGTEFDLWATALLLSAPHESGLVSSLVGIGTSHGSKNVVQALGGNSEKTRLEKIGPVVGRESSKSRSVHDGADHLRARSGLEKGRVVVTDGNGSNLSEAVAIVSSDLAMYTQYK